MTADEIVRRNAEARGGLADWLAVQSMVMRGEMDAGHGVKLPYLLELKRSRKMRLELQFRGKTAVQVYDGAHGWKLRPFLGRSDVEAFTAGELRAAAGQSELDGLLIDSKAKGYKVELVGTEPVEGKDAYKLKITMPGGISRNLWVDTVSLLEVKIDSKRKMDGKERVMETYLRDYRSERGLLMPHLLETATEGVKGTQKLTVQSVVFNPPLDDTRFAKP